MFNNSSISGLRLEDALDRILAEISSPKHELTQTRMAADRFLAEIPRALVSLPPFDNSSMDGYAVRSEDALDASTRKPVRLSIKGRVEAGGLFRETLSPRECARVFTGSALPAGADAVVMQEDTQSVETGDSIIDILAPVRPLENIRLAGEDLRRGVGLGKIGEQITPVMMALLQAAGVREVAVSRKPRVSVLATGSELIEVEEEVSAGKIYESNRAMLAALAVKAGAQTRVFPIVRDTLEETRIALEKAFAESDLVVTCGGVSVGEMDFVKPAYERMGGQLNFWKVAIRPGRPFAFGKLGEKLLMGLPGNPVSAFVTFLLLVRPAILRWQGAHELSLPVRNGRLTEEIRNSQDRRHFARVFIDASGNIRLAGAQASHVLSSLAAGNALLDLPPGCDWKVGSEVKCLLYGNV